MEWIESDGDYAHIHAAGKVHLISVRMHALESLLDPQRFLRVHRSIIVCLARVSESGGYWLSGKSAHPGDGHAAKHALYWSPHPSWTHA